MKDKEILGKFKGGGLRSGQFRSVTFLTLACYSYIFLRLFSPAGILDGMTALPSLLAAGAGFTFLVWEVMRMGVVEEISIDYERGQVVRRRSVFGIKQSIPLANLEAITGIVLSGADRSLFGYRIPCWMVYILAGPTQAIPVRCEKSSFETILKRDCQQLANRLGTPFEATAIKDRLSVKRGTGRVEFSEPSKTLKALRIALLAPAWTCILGFYYVLGVLLWRGFLF